MSNREQFEVWGCSDVDLRITLESETYAGIAWMAWEAATQATEARLAAMAAELKQSQIDAGCYKKGMEASNDRLVQLAAENAGLKAAAKETLGHWAAAEPGEMEQMMDKCMPGLRFAYCETQATDAYLAEVRAQGVERMIDVKQQQLDGMHPDTFAIGAVRDSIRRDIYELKVFAEILRQEAAQ